MDDKLGCLFWGLVIFLICGYYLLFDVPSAKLWIGFGFSILLILLWGYLFVCERCEYKIDTKDREIFLLNTKIKDLIQKAENREKHIDLLTFRLENIVNGINKIKNKKVDENFLYRISNIISDFAIAEYIESEVFFRTKKYPALKKAKEIKELKDNTKFIINDFNLLKYKYELIFTVFPELEVYFESIDDILNVSYQNIDDLKESYDYSRNYLTKEEWGELSSEERNQKALDRYIQGNKTNWQIGRDFELFCGQKLEKKGYKVEYTGTINKLSDLGRDLIAHKGNNILIIQCKYWSHAKQIREKHIAQLYGSAKVYEITNLKNELKPYKIIPKIITHSDLSEEAKEFAKLLNIEIVKTKLSDFPRIKCNINSSGEKIYHLPFDQQYDRTKIDEVKGEFYAFTIKEAEEKGFRRAMRFNYFK